VDCWHCCKMNNRQKWVCWGALTFFCLTLLTVPVSFPAVNEWGVKDIGFLRIPLWKVGAFPKIRMDILTVEWIGIGVIAAFLFFLIKGVAKTAKADAYTPLQAQKVSEIRTNSPKTKRPARIWKFWLIFTVILLIGVGVVIWPILSSPSSKESQQQDQSRGVTLNVNQSPQTDEAYALISNQKSNVTVRKAIPVGNNASAQQTNGNIFDQFDTPNQSAIPTKGYGSFAQFVPAQDQPAATAAPTPNVNPFTIGSSMKDVSDVMGLPDSLEKSDLQVQMVNFKIVRRYAHAIWHYGNSTVTFENGKVTKYDNASGNLRVRSNH